jgi:copper ion binding protein
MAVTKSREEALTMEFLIEGMSCASCVGRVERAIQGVNGVTSTSVNLATGRANVSFGSADRDPRAVADAIRKVGYEPVPATVEFHVKGMTCASCVARVEKFLKRVPGVITAAVNVATERATVTFFGKADVVPRLIEAVAEAGYEAVEVRPDSDHTNRQEMARDAETVLLRRSLIIAALLTLPVFVLEMPAHVIPGVEAWIMSTLGHDESRYVQFALTTLILFGPAQRFYRKGVPALLRLAPDMNSLVALGTGECLLRSGGRHRNSDLVWTLSGSQSEGADIGCDQAFDRVDAQNRARAPRG